MNEHGFVKAVHRHLPSDLYRWKIHDTFTGGVPDAMYAGPAGTLFVEYKYVTKLPKKDTTAIKIGLSALQLQWLRRMHLYNTLCMVIIGAPDGAVICTDLKWEQKLTKINFKNALSSKAVADRIQEVVQGTKHERRHPDSSAEP
jgi:hypothetical protein